MPAFWKRWNPPWPPIRSSPASTPKSMTPLRGEVWVFDLGMTEKVRPALVVSVVYGDADRALLTVVPHTTSLRGSQYEVAVDVAFSGWEHFWCKASRRIPTSGPFGDWES